MAGPTDLFDVAQEILDAATASLDEIVSPLSPAPERRYVRYGLPSDDCCEQLVVHVNPILELQTAGGPPAGRRFPAAWLNQVTFTITVGRCVPVPEVKGKTILLPPTEDMEEAAEQVLADAWALWNGMHNRAAAEEIGDTFSRCSNITFDPIQARTPSGGCAGWLMDIRMVVPGYPMAGT